MKEIWNRYSYAIILITLSITITAVLAVKAHISDGTEEYLTITVSEGDSLWLLSEKYNDKHDLSADRFVNWVKKKNRIENSLIYAGETLVIPVLKEDLYLKEYASK